MSEKKKALLVTTISGFVPQFEMNNVKLLQDMGYEVHYAANYNTPVYTDNNHRLDGTGIVRHQVDFVRSPFRIVKNIKAYRQLREVMKREKYDLLHCHTPMGGAIGRIAAKKAKVPYVIYTAHGFHFYKGSPIINWLFFYPVERFLARYTDVLITINEEDFRAAKKYGAKKIIKIPGPGFECEKFKEKFIDINNKKKSLGIPEDSFVLITVGELNKNKNQIEVLKALAQIKNRNIFYILCGKGEYEKKLKKYVQKKGLNNNVRFLGFRSDVNEILACCDCYVMSSKREGLGIAVLEAMISGMPVVVSSNRGSRELVKDKKSGFICRKNHYKYYIKGIIDVFDLTNEERIRIGNYNASLAEKFDGTITGDIMKKIYLEIK